VRSSAFIPPCIPTLRDRLPKCEGWQFELKFDGYRVQLHKAGASSTLFGRNGAISHAASRPSPRPSSGSRRDPASSMVDRGRPPRPAGLPLRCYTGDMCRRASIASICLNSNGHPCASRRCPQGRGVSTRPARRWRSGVGVAVPKGTIKPDIREQAHHRHHEAEAQQRERRHQQSERRERTQDDSPNRAGP
jgi:hypothetical protein